MNQGSEAGQCRKCMSNFRPASRSRTFGSPPATPPKSRRDHLSVTPSAFLVEWRLSNHRRIAGICTDTKSCILVVTAISTVTHDAVRTRWERTPVKREPRQWPTDMLATALSGPMEFGRCNSFNPALARLDRPARLFSFLRCSPSLALGDGSFQSVIHLLARWRRARRRSASIAPMEVSMSYVPTIHRGEICGRRIKLLTKTPPLSSAHTVLRLFARTRCTRCANCSNGS
jgi:hypothetical protein